MASPQKIYVLCADCGGTGKDSSGDPCPNCKGTGQVAQWATGKRRFRRYLTNLPITVNFRERDIDGYCTQIAEGGLGALLQEPVPVESLVSIQFAVPNPPTKLHLQSQVRYSYGFQHGLEFLALREEERLAIRDFCTQLPSVSFEEVSAFENSQ